MKRAAPDRPLLEAADRLDRALAEHGKAARELERLGVGSRRELVRGAELVSQIAAHDRALADEMQAFVAALTRAREVQQADADRVQARALALVGRRGELEALDRRLGLLAEAIRTVGALVATIKQGGEPALEVLEALGQIEQLADGARVVSEDARAAGFPDVADEAHALRQQLEAVGRKADALGARRPKA
jgi:hypothetical protein